MEVEVEVEEEEAPHRPRRERAVRALLQRCGRVARQHGAQRGAIAKRRVGAQRHGAGAVARRGELLGFVPALQLRLGVENKAAQPSASWRSGGSFSAPDHALGDPELRSASAN